MGKVEIEVEVKSSADKFWRGIKDSTKIYPKIFPKTYKSIEVLEGDGVSVGSIRIVKFAEGIPCITYSKEKIEVSDEANKSVTYSVIEGELTNFYKTFKSSLQVVLKGDGSLVKWSLNFEKACDEVPDPNISQESVIKAFNALDDYLLKAYKSIEIEVEVKSSADKFWEAIKDSTKICLAIFPETYKSIEILEGDGVGAGSIRILNFVEGMMPGMTFTKEKIEALDEANKSITYSVTEGELTNFYKSFITNLQVVPKGDGSLVKWSLEYLKVSDEIPDPKAKEAITQAMNGLDTYLLKAGTPKLRTANIQYLIS